VVAAAPKTSRASPPEDIYKVAVKYNKNVTIAAEVETAVRQALTEAKEDDIICISGSVYTVGEARRFFIGKLGKGKKRKCKEVITLKKD
jgi:dihydrofolate synthase/folylpolyglutamate synthase